MPAPQAARSRALPPIGTARETLDEFFVGLWKDGAQALSLRGLDLCWGARWRYSAALKQRYYSKRDMVRGIEKLAAERGELVDEVAAALDGLGLSDYQIARALKRGRRLLG